MILPNKQLRLQIHHPSYLRYFIFGIKISLFLDELWFHFLLSNTFILITVTWEQFWIS